MKLIEINEKYKSDKGVVHSYLEKYETIFSEIKDKKNNILEIGVLFGNSLKLWHDYFQNSDIYGIDDFSQQDGHEYYNHKKVDVNEIQNGLSEYSRVKLLNFNCEDLSKIEQNLKQIKFDIIIDDASHKLNQQKINITNYFPYLKKDGIYICEDIQTDENAKELSKHVSEVCKECESTEMILNVTNISDDRLLIVKNK